MMKQNVILEKSFEFAFGIVEFSEELENCRKFVIANQILRSGTSIGANINEAQSCESRADFIHKLKIAAKEAHETDYWFSLCNHSKSYPYNDSLHLKLEEIQKLLSSNLSSSKRNNT